MGIKCIELIFEDTAYMGEKKMQRNSILLNANKVSTMFLKHNISESSVSRYVVNSCNIFRRELPQIICFLGEYTTNVQIKIQCVLKVYG